MRKILLHSNYRIWLLFKMVLQYVIPTYFVFTALEHLVQAHQSKYKPSEAAK